MPPQGAKLELALGYGNSLTKIGLFTVDDISSAGPAATLTIKAKAADMIEGLKAPKTRSWGAESLESIISAIATEHGLTPRIAPSLGSIIVAPIPYAQIDQTNESDLNFLRRLAQQYDAVSKPVFGHLIFVPKGEAKSASGQSIAKITLSERDVTRWSARAPQRGNYKSAKAYWINPQSQEREYVSAGSGEPALSLRHSYGSRAEAEHAARAKLNSAQRGAATLTLSLPGRPDLAAEGRISFKTKDSLAAGEWIITRAEHELSGGSSGGFTSQIECETPKEITT